MSYIYKIFNDINDQVYIGQTRGSVESRLKEHLYDARVNKDNNKFHKAIRELGSDHFSISIIEECPTEHLNERERFWIAHYDSQEHGYNSTRGGQNDPYIQTQMKLFSIIYFIVMKKHLLRLPKT